MENPTFRLEGVIKSKEEMQDFEGPLTLILMLLSKNKIEIRDVRISEILDQYLEWLERMQSMDLEIASEFVQMASHLVYIKTKMLLAGTEEVSELELLLSSLEQLQSRDTFQAVKEVLPAMADSLARGALLALLVILQILYKQTIGDGEIVRRGQLSLRLPLGVAGGAFLLCGCLGPAALSRVLGNPVTQFFSAVSYNFYIWHQFIAVRLKALHIPPYASELPNQAAEQPWMTRYTWLCFAAAVAVGAAFTYLCERPIYRKAMQHRTPIENLR